MKKVIVLLLVVFNLLACQKKEAVTKEEKKTCTPEGKQFDMYQMSEMAALMEQMYVENKRLKERIIKGDTIGKFPKYFLNINLAAFTDESDNDDFFRENATLYIKAQQLLYNDSKNVKANYNAGIDACVKCHEKKCGGPIVKIKKLYLK